MFDNIDLGDSSAEAMREPIVLVDKRKNKETHVVVSPQYTFEDIVHSAKRLNDELFQGDWDLYYIDPQSKKPIPISEDAVLLDFLDQNVDTFYWNYKLSGFRGAKARKEIRNTFAGRKKEQNRRAYAPLSKGKYANVFRRFAALLIDIIVISIVAGIFGFISTPIVALFYFAIMESSNYQSTLGKMVFNMKVTDELGHKLSFANAMGRNIVKGLSMTIFAPVLAVALFSKKKQGLHDILAKTIVVEEQEKGAYAS